MKKLIIDISSKTNPDSKYSNIMDYTANMKSFDKISTDYSTAKRSPAVSTEYSLSSL